MQNDSLRGCEHARERSLIAKCAAIVYINVVKEISHRLVVAQCNGGTLCSISVCSFPNPALAQKNTDATNPVEVVAVVLVGQEILVRRP